MIKRVKQIGKISLYICKKNSRHDQKDLQNTNF